MVSSSSFLDFLLTSIQKALGNLTSVKRKSNKINESQKARAISAELSAIKIKGNPF